ncbi:MAG: hypothetical protein A2096_08875 [Spirochaetes bacterium GWF1_41_5]|nr:MAG: hypothetical protein A2096_08875 [Spirochaetes bacterium GWF1_41_5]HBE04511.1 hypothetical protein [Spirochaetia bacterium]
MIFTVFICRECGYTIEVNSNNLMSRRYLNKLLHEHSITAALFGCPACSREIKNNLEASARVQAKKVVSIAA